MTRIVFPKAADWLDAVIEWRDSRAEPWVHLVEVLETDQDQVSWTISVRGAANYGLCLWTFRHRINGGLNMESEKYRLAVAQSVEMVEHYAAMLTTAGIAAVRGYAQEGGNHRG